MFTFGSYRCDNCKSLNVNDDAKLSLSCGTICPDVVWFIEGPKPLTASLIQCL